jgi:hypothetical protein
VAPNVQNLCEQASREQEIKLAKNDVWSSQVTVISGPTLKLPYEKLASEGSAAEWNKLQGKYAKILEGKVDKFCRDGTEKSS